MEHWWNDTDREKEKYWRKACPRATWSTNLAWTDLASNPSKTGAGEVNSKVAVIFLLTASLERFTGFACLSFW